MVFQVDILYVGRVYRYLHSEFKKNETLFLNFDKTVSTLSSTWAKYVAWFSLKPVNAPFSMCAHKL
jgi:hypothetical protein